MGIKITLSGAQTGLTDIFACVSKDDAGTTKTHRGSDTWEVWNIANLDLYDMPSSEIGNSGIYEVDFPSIAAGKYHVKFYRGTPSTQTITHYYPTGTMNWNGTEEVFVMDNNGQVKLASDGLDNVSVTEPSGDPAGWNFRQLFMWFMARFRNKHEKDSTNKEINIYNASGTKITKQSYTAVGSDETVEKVAQP